MITLDISLAIALYTFLLLGGIFAFWVFGKREKRKDLTIDPRYIWFCSICTYTYINTREDLITVCPRCGNYNKK